MGHWVNAGYFTLSDVENLKNVLSRDVIISNLFLKIVLVAI